MKRTKYPIRIVRSEVEQPERRKVFKSTEQFKRYMLRIGYKKEWVNSVIFQLKRRVIFTRTHKYQLKRRKR